MARSISEIINIMLVWPAFSAPKYFAVASGGTCQRPLSMIIVAVTPVAIFHESRSDVREALVKYAECGSSETSKKMKENNGIAVACGPYNSNVIKL